MMQDEMTDLQNDFTEKFNKMCQTLESLRVDDEYSSRPVSASDARSPGDESGQTKKAPK